MKTLQRSIKASKRERPRHCDSRLLQGASAIAVAAPGSIEWLGTVNGTVGNISKRKPNRTPISNLSPAISNDSLHLYVFWIFWYVSCSGCFSRNNQQLGPAALDIVDTRCCSHWVICQTAGKKDLLWSVIIVIYSFKIYSYHTCLIWFASVTQFPQTP